MRFNRCSYLAAAGTLASSIVLSGCSGSIVPVPTENSQAITGNWQISSTAAAASRLPALSGELTGSQSAITGIFHSNSATSCVPPTTAIDLTGQAYATNAVTLTGALAGGVLTIAGNLAADGKSLTQTTYNVTGGPCAFASQADATAQAYSSVTGTYAGTLSDSSGPVISITASLTQTSAPDANGNFQISGTGSFPDSSCFSSPVSVSNSQVTGGSVSLTYTDPVKQNSVTASGTFSQDASTLTITNWVLSGPCGSDSGTGVFTRQ